MSPSSAEIRIVEPLSNRVIACIFCQDIEHKMNDKIEVFLENDEHADKNRFH